MTETTDRANATAKCPGSYDAAKFVRGDVFGCCSCQYTFEAKVDSKLNVVAPWHRAVR